MPDQNHCLPPRLDHQLGAWNRESPDDPDGEDDVQDGVDGDEVRKVALASITANLRMKVDGQS